MAVPSSLPAAQQLPLNNLSLSSSQSTEHSAASIFSPHIPISNTNRATPGSGGTEALDDPPSSSTAVPSSADPKSSSGLQKPDAYPKPKENVSITDPHGQLDMSQSSQNHQPRAALKEVQNDTDGDKPEDASMTPTLTGTKPSSAPAPRKVNESSISDAAVTTSKVGSGTSKPRSIGHSTKSSFFSKFIRLFVPCISTSPQTHPIETDLLPQPPRGVPAVLKEKGDVKAGPVVEAPLNNVPESANTSTATASEPLPSKREVPVQPTEPNVVAEVDPQLSKPSQSPPLSDPDVATSGLPELTGPTEEEVHPQNITLAEPVTSNGRNSDEDSDATSFTEDDEIEGENEEDGPMDGGSGIPIGPDGIPRPLLPPISPQHVGRKCLVLDLDETLVHSSFKSIQQADYVVPVEIEYHWHNVYVIKRPGVDNFLKKMGEIYEIVVFTASLSKYADPVLDKLDIHQVVTHRLFRESCFNYKMNYVKDLSQLGRPITDTIILDNSPASYMFHPNNAVPVSSWFNDPHDTELTDLVPFLADLSTVDDVRGILDGGR